MKEEKRERGREEEMGTEVEERREKEGGREIGERMKERRDEDGREVETGEEERN